MQKRIIYLILFVLLITPYISWSRQNKTDFFQRKNSQVEQWVGTWSTAPLLVGKNDMPPGSGLTNNTLRQVVRVSIGGDVIRLRFSNIFGKEPVTMKSVSIAGSEDGSKIDEGTQKLLTFHKKNQITISPNTEMYSDPVKFKLLPGSRLAITIYFGETSATITGHPGSRTTSYLLAGDHIKSIDFKDAVKTDRWYIINGVEVQAGSGAAAIAVLGNSITDGRGSGTNKQNRWTDILSERLLDNPPTRNYGVLNLGIGGNSVVRGGLGPTALNRIDRDIFSQNGVRWLIILQGINDIGGIKVAEDVDNTIKRLIDAYILMINKAQAKGIKVYGCTILPYGDSGYDKGFSFRQRARDEVNRWIRTSGQFDAVIDFDKAMRSEDNVNEIAYGLHTGDFLHPNEAGYKRMGESVDLNLFK